MKCPTPRTVAWMIVAVALALSSGAVALAAWSDHGTLGEKLGNSLVVSLPYPILGAILIARLPKNAIGWLLAAIGLLQGVNIFTDEYAYRAFIVRPGSLPFGGEIAWVSFWTWMPSLALLVTLVLLLFPDGRPPSRRWRWAVWLAAGGITVLVLGVGSAAWPYRGTGLDVTNSGDDVGGPALLVALAGALAILFSAVVCIVSLVVRFRRSIADERLQLKWFTYAGAVTVAAISAQFLPLPLEYDVLYGALIATGLLVIPGAVAVAVLKYRLYDIDRIISRTLVYGVLTAFLGATYFVAVILLQAVLGERITDQPLAVAATTLAVAALFRPARARIQGAIDRRFNRRKYDAQLTVEAFSARLRDEIDLKELSADLVAVVSNTMQPSHVSLWVRSTEEPLPVARGRE